MKRLSGLDASFLYLETSTQLLHVCGLFVLQPDSLGSDYRFETMKRQVEERVTGVAEFRRKLRHVPLELDHPVWVDDQDFDIDRHVHRLALPAPGSETELAEVAGHLAGIPLDRSRPLWEMWFIEGLADGRVAVVTKMHHCTVDGMSGMNLLAHLCTLEPGESPQPAPADTVSRELGSTPSDLSLLGRAVLRNAARPWQLAKILAPTASALLGTADRARKGTAMPAPLTAPRTPFNGTISGRRAIAFCDLSLEEVKEVKRATGATVNDVILTLCGGALRRYLESRDALPSASLLATVPVSVREESSAEGANQVSALFARLETQEADPVERLRQVTEGNARAKEHNKAIPASALQEWAEFSAPRTFGLAARAYSGWRLAEKHPVVHNLVVSNVPGPPVPIYFMGALIEAMYPLGPVFHGAGLNITVISNNGRVHVGLIACAEAVPDLWELARDFPEELTALRKAVGLGGEGGEGGEG